MKELTLKSYAKINLALDVTGVLDDGYHGVDTVMQQVSLADEICLTWKAAEPGEATEAGEQGFSLDIRIHCNKPYLPTDQRNLAWKAAELMAGEAVRRGRVIAGSLGIHIEKRIPVAAGLAGGSGNAAAVMIGLNTLWGLKLSTRKLCRIGEVLGADIPFCILVQNTHHRCALGTGKGEKLTPIKKGLRKYIVLAKPAFGVSTKEVFAGIDDCEIPRHPQIGKLMTAIGSGQIDDLYDEMINVLEEYTLIKYPPVAQLKERLAATAGVRKVLMSGSGPTVFGLYDSFGAAKKACMKMREQGYEAYWADTFHMR